MEQLSALLEKFQTKSRTVAINISSRSILEVIEYNKEGIINNYISLPIQYNAFTKEIENINDFESAIKRAFSELSLSMSSKAFVSIPTFIIETEIVPKAVAEDDESIKTYLTASAEKNYIFKKYDPAISYFKNTSDDASEESVTVAYTALRQDEFSKITSVFEALGLKVAAIDSSYSTLINGVIATQKVNPNILNNNDNWNIINITSNSFTLFAMKGREMVGVYEEPLAVKSFTEEEIYQVISNSLDLVLDKYPSSQIVIVSQSDNVSAEYLTSIINSDATKAYIEDNKYRKQLVEVGYNITQSNKTKISLEAVGTASWQFNDNGFKFNFINTPTAAAATVNEVESITVPWINGSEIELTPPLIKKYAIAYMLFMVVVAAILCGLLFSTKNGYEQTQETLNSQIADIESKLETKPTKTGITEAEFLNNSYTNNLNLKKSYAAIAREIPDMLWIEEVQLADDSKLYMTGRSYRMEDILNYYDSLNKLGKFPNLKISVLGISNNRLSDLLQTDMREETTYEFAFGQAISGGASAAPDSEQGAKEGDKDKKPSGPPSDVQTQADIVPPAPTAIPKEDN